MQSKASLFNFMNNISRKEFLKDLSYISLGVISFSNMLIAAEAGNLILKNIYPIENDPNGILKLMKGFNYSIISDPGFGNPEIQATQNNEFAQLLWYPDVVGNNQQFQIRIEDFNRIG